MWTEFSFVFKERFKILISSLLNIPGRNYKVFQGVLTHIGIAFALRKSP